MALCQEPIVTLYLLGNLRSEIQQESLSEGGQFYEKG
jgi:hypothetical protein